MKIILNSLQLKLDRCKESLFTLVYAGIGLSTMWLLVGRVCRLEGHGFEFRSSRHVGTLGKSFTCSCQWRFGVKPRHSILAVKGGPLSSSGLEEVL